VPRCRCCPAPLPPGVPGALAPVSVRAERAPSSSPGRARTALAAAVATAAAGAAGAAVACLRVLCLTSHGLFRLVGVECSLSHFLIFFSPCMLACAIVLLLCPFCPVWKICVGGVTGNPQVEGTEGTEGRAPWEAGTPRCSSISTRKLPFPTASSSAAASGTRSRYSKLNHKHFRLKLNHKHLNLN